MMMKDYLDNQLLHLLSEGSASESRLALSQLYEKYSKDVFSYLMYYTRNNQQLSKDILQDVFITIFEKSNQFNSSKAFKPWAIQIASNLCKNKYKRQALETQFISSQDANKTESLEADSKQDIHQAIKSLEWNFREVIILKYKLKMSLSEISELLKIPEGTVKSRLYYASKTLAEHQNIKNLKS